MGRFPKPARNNGTNADIHNGMNADIHNGTNADIHAKHMRKVKLSYLQE